jgi:RHS repeat-associated protein
MDLSGLTSMVGASLTATNGGFIKLNGTIPTGANTGIVLGVNGVLRVGGSIVLAGSTISNSGVIDLQDGANLELNAPISVNGVGIITAPSSATIHVKTNLLGTTKNADLYHPLATVLFDGSGTAANPQWLEVMSRDLGGVTAGFSKNFVYSTLALDNNTYVKLIDLNDNATGTDPEALYVNSLVVPAGCTLDLNGFHLYARQMQVQGSIVGQVVNQIADSGPILLASPTPAAIGATGEMDEWTFYGRAGRTVTVVVNPGSDWPAALPPWLNWADVKLLDSAGTVLQSAASTSQGTKMVLTAQLPSDGTYRIQVRASVNHLAATGNYLITVYDTSLNTAPLQLNQAGLGVIENPYAEDHWTFSASAGQQIRFDLLNATTSSIRFSLSGPNGWVGFSDINSNSDLITLPSSGQYVLSVHSTGEQSGTYAFKVEQTSVTDLSLGTAYNGTLTGSAQAQLFRVTVATGQPMRITLDDSSALDSNELYVKFGTPPTRSDYDYRFSTPSSSDQQILVPMASPGTWYILVYGDNIPAHSTYTLLAETSAMFVSDLPSMEIGNSTDTTLTVTGAGFQAGTTVQFETPSGTVLATGLVRVDSSTRAGVDIPAGLPAGPLVIRYTQPGGGSILAGGFINILSGGEAKVETKIIVPSQLGRHATATLYVEYTNTGTVAMRAPLLVVHGDDKALLTLDKSRVVAGFWTSALPAGFSDTVQILASGQTPGWLMPGESGQVPVYYAGLLQPWDFSDTSVDFNVSVVRTDSTTALNWSDFKDQLRPDSVSADAWTPIWNNFISQVGTTTGSYVSMLDDNAAYLGRLGESVSDVGALLGFELQQANGLSPYSTLSSATDASVAAPGLTLTFARFFGSSIADRYVSGPLGYGWSDNWQYSLQVESDGTVNISEPGGSIRTFQPDSRSGGYFADAGDYGTLTVIGGGVFSMQETDGTIMRFRADGKLDYIQDTNGNRITAGYTGSLLTSLTHSSGQFIQITYNAFGRVAQVTDSAGHTEQYVYDASGEHLLSVTGSGGTTSYTYETGMGVARENALASVTNPGNFHRYFTYDVQGRLSSTYKDGNAERLVFGYDSAGTVSITDADGGTERLFFDYRNLVPKIEDPLGRTVTGSFDNNFNITSATDPAGWTTTYTYDSHGNVTRILDPLGHSTQFTYTTSFNRLASLTDANGHVTRYVYDDDGNLLSTTYADGTAEQMSYDAYGDPLSLVNRRGTPIGYSYNTAGQLTRKTFSDGSHIDYAYDTHGNLISATDAAGTTTLTYNSADRLTEIAYPNGRFLKFTYDASGRRTRSVDQDGFTVNYHYDAAGRLAGLTDGDGANIVTYTYDSAGRLIREDKGNGTYTTYEYDLAGQLLHLVNYAPDSSVNSRFDYTYDNAGQRTSMATLDGTWTYTYDATGQLIHAVLLSTNPSIPSQDLTYVYDAMGNRIRTIENGVTTEYTTNNMNQYTIVGTAVCTYDADGNLIRKVDGTEVTTYCYDAENRLIQVVTPEGTWNYEYDAFGNRIATTRDGVRVEYLLDPAGLVNVVGEYDTAGKAIAHYTYGLGLVSLMDASNSVAYYDFDAIGNTFELTGTTGRVVNRYAYTPFGASLFETVNAPNGLQYVGELGVMNEANGLDFMRARFYDSVSGRFQNQDPIRLLGGLNLYRYVQNNPVSSNDPVGLDPDLWRSKAEDSQSFWHHASHYPGEPDREWSPQPNFGDAKHHHDRYERGDPDWWRDRDDSDLDPPPGWPFDKWPPEDWPPEGWPPGEPGPGGTGIDIGEMDPNEKTGPSGFGTVNYITAVNPLSYCIEFENDPAATAPAQQVTITDQLDSNLDWKTFELTEIGFGDHVLSIPAGSQHYQTTVDMTYNGANFQVQIEAGLRADTGQVYIRFLSIDPNTDLPPNVLIGFLPPEDGTGRGQGYVGYVIQAKSGLASGTEIRNVADVQFGLGEIIATDQVDPHDPGQGIDPTKECLNTIDAGTPTSSVNPLPNQVNSNAFSVSWSGADEIGGSGIASYDVYVSDNSGAYALWLDDTTATSATYNGKNGHTYAFYSCSRDNVGHVEAAPMAADAQTTVDQTPPTVTAVLVRSSGWSNTFLDAIDSQGLGYTGISRLGYLIPSGSQLTALPWTNLDTLTIVFSEDVNITADNIAIVGVNTANYTGTFHYDSSTFTATWTFPQALTADKLLLDIQGGTSGVTDKAGNTMSGDLLLHINVLPGDVNRDEMVVSNDLIKVRNLLSTSPNDTAYSIFMDVNGDGMIISNDLIKVRNLLSTALPTNDPVAPTRSSVAAATMPVVENSVATTTNSTMAEQPTIVSSSSNVVSMTVAENIVATAIEKVKAEQPAIVSFSLTVAPSQNVSVAETVRSAPVAKNELSPAPLEETAIVPMYSQKGQTETQAITPSVIYVLSNSTKAVSPMAMAVDAILRESIFAEKVDSPPTITGKQISLDSTDEKKPIKSDSLRTYAKAVSTILADSQLLFHNDLLSSLIQSRAKDSDKIHFSRSEDFEDAFEDMFVELSHPTAKTWRRAKST